MEAEGDEAFTFNLLAVVTCICCGATAAGLTMGLLSLDGLKLKVKVVTGTEEEKKYVSTLLPLLEDHHFLLCTLLIFNAVANEAMPIFLDDLVPPWAAIIVSVTLVLVFGEIVPTATFTGPNQLRMVAACAPLVYLLQFLFYPVARPMASLLDLWLGHDESGELYSRDELAAMVRILRSQAADVPYTGEAEVVSPMMAPTLTKVPCISDADGGDDKVQQLPTVSEENTHGDNDDEEPLTGNEVNVITGVLGLSRMTVLDIHTPLSEVDMLSDSQIFDDATVQVLVKSGHSRLPVFCGGNRKNIVGIFRTKRLIDKDPDETLNMSQFVLRKPLIVGAGQSPLTVLNLFQQGHSHIALVSHNPRALLESISAGVAPDSSFEPVGIITLEDIIEAMLQSQIYDEDDLRENEQAVNSRNELYSLSMSASATPRSTPALEEALSQKSTAPRTAAGAGEEGELEPVTQKPSLLKSLSAPFSSSNTPTGPAAGLLDREDASADNSYQSMEEAMPAQKQPTLSRSRSATTGRKQDKRSNSVKASFYRKYDGVYDELGVPLIPPQDGAHMEQLLSTSPSTGSSLAAQNTLGKHFLGSMSKKVTPSLVNKYVKAKYYAVGDNDYSGGIGVQRSRSRSEAEPSLRSASSKY